MQSFTKDPSVAEKYPLVQRLIVSIKQHRNPSSPKSISVLLKVMDDQILKPGNYTVDQLITELENALASDTVWSATIRQQHSEEELRGCFTNLLAGLQSPDEEEEV